MLRFTRRVSGVCSSSFTLNATMKYRIERYRNENSGFVDQFICSIYELDLSSGAADSEVMQRMNF